MRRGGTWFHIYLSGLCKEKNICSDTNHEISPGNTVNTSLPCPEPSCPTCPPPLAVPSSFKSRSKENTVFAATLPMPFVFCCARRMSLARTVAFSTPMAFHPSWLRRGPCGCPPKGSTDEWSIRSIDSTEERSLLFFHSSEVL